MWPQKIGHWPTAIALPHRPCGKPQAAITAQCQKQKMAAKHRLKHYSAEVSGVVSKPASLTVLGYVLSNKGRRTVLCNVPVTVIRGGPLNHADAGPEEAN